MGEGCFYLDMIVWLNGDRVEMGDRVGFNYGCYVNGYGGLTIGDRSIFGPYTMIHTANHEMDLGRADPRPGLVARSVTVGADCWIGMGVCILPGRDHRRGLRGRRRRRRGEGPRALLDRGRATRPGPSATAASARA